jgi:subfamily B ATP-binding cassette protein MsbA
MPNRFKLESQTFKHVQKIFSFLKRSKVNMWFIPLSVFLSFCYTQVMMYVIGLLFPLTQGIVSNDFNHVRNLDYVGLIVQWFPHTFTTSTKLFVLLVCWIYLSTIVKNVFFYFAALTAQIQAKIATISLRQMLVEKCLSLGKEFYDKNTISFLQSVLTKSTEVVESRFMLFQNFMTQALLMITYLYFMFKISWMLTCITAIAFPLIAWITRLMVHRIRALSMEQERLAKSLNEKIFNMLYCMPVIKSFAKEKEEQASFHQASKEELNQSFNIQKITGLAEPIEDIGTMTGLLFVALAMALVMHVDQALTASNAFVFFYLAMRAVPSLNALNRFKLGVSTSTTSLEDIEQILDKSDIFNVPSGVEEFTGLKNAIEFKDLSFRYSGGSYILENINFSIEKKSMVAIVGPSGSGKSTLVNLLLRFYDVPEGAIWIDGKDIRCYNMTSLRQQMAFVSQDVLLFNQTIRHNITYGAGPDFSEASLHDLMQKVHLHDFIETMPHQYDTLVGERGARLSGGERQRLAIARAIIRDSDILIMDEATSALDSQTEARMTEGILAMSKEKTMIIIAHRLSTIKKADKIIYIEGGKVQETGTFQELIDKHGSFYQQWENQRI